MMTHDEFVAFWEANNNEYLKHDRADPAHKVTPFADLNGILLLMKFATPSGKDIISASEHDEIFLDVDPKRVREEATPQEMLDLIRFGVRHSEKYDCFCMFV